MKIAVIAANGRTGRVFVEAALAAGHQVQAGVHRTHTLVPHQNLAIVTCDATKQTDLAALFKGQEAIISFVGHDKHSPPHLQTTVIQTALPVMHELGITRIVSLTGTGVRIPGDNIPPIDRLLNLGISRIDPARIQDGKDHVRALEASDVDWTVIRVLKLLDRRQAQPFQLLLHGPTRWFTSRRTVANAVLQVLEQHSFVQQAPIIGK